MFYFDHNSTTPVNPEVIRVMLPFLENDFGNPSSLSSLGVKAKEAIEQARGELAALVGAKEEEVVFLSGGTESIFAALVGVFNGASANGASRRRHIVISAVEHPAVFEAVRYLERFLGAESTVVPVRADGSLDLEDLKNSIREDTALVSIMLANNETGVIFPVDEVVELAHERGVLIHTDAVQAIGKMTVCFDDLGVDLLSLSGHKFGAPKGVGALIVREGIVWEPLVKGGGQERGRRGGTEAVSQIVALGAAAKIRKQLLEGGFEQKTADLRDYFEHTLLERISGCVINGGQSRRLSNTSSFVITDVLAQDLISVLNSRSFFVSSGSACKAKTVEPSHVLKAMGMTLLSCLSTIRVSMGTDSSEKEVYALLQILKETVGELRAKNKKL